MDIIKFLKKYKIYSLSTMFNGNKFRNISSLWTYSTLNSQWWPSLNPTGINFIVHDPVISVLHPPGSK